MELKWYARAILMSSHARSVPIESPITGHYTSISENMENVLTVFRPLFCWHYSVIEDIAPVALSTSYQSNVAV